MLVHVNEEDRPYFSQKAIRSAHRINEVENFDKDRVVDVLSSIPRTHLRVYASLGDDMPLTSWQLVDTACVSGAEIYDCLERGRFWINIQRIDQLDERYKTLSANLYADLGKQIAGFAPEYIHSYLLLSSPRTAVNFHLDAYENFFWCIKGTKSFHLYDIDSPVIFSQKHLEEICAGADDFIPYREEFESHSRVIELQPGEMLSWKQHSPHYTVNHDELNIGLGTFHGTPESYRRVQNFVASDYFRRKFPLLHGSVKHEHLGTALRRNIYGAIQKFWPRPHAAKTVFTTDLRLDPAAACCFTKIESGPVVAECNRSAA